MLKVSEILRVKGNTLYTATSDTLVLQAIETMSEQDIGSLVIMDRGELMGMVTFREIIRHLHAKQGNTGENTVRSIMNDAPISVTPNTSADEVQRLMLEKHARYIPVMDGPMLLGVISFYDMRSEEHTSELQSLMRSSYAVCCLKKKNSLSYILPFRYPREKPISTIPDILELFSKIIAQYGFNNTQQQRVSSYTDHTPKFESITTREDGSHIAVTRYA